MNVIPNGTEKPIYISPMTKQESIVNISTILNRKSSSDGETDFFADKNHDDLLDLLLRYIENSSPLIGNPKVFKTQSLNDHGVDLIIEYPNTCKIGVQIKSHFDVKGEDFAVKVKSQLAESQYHGLDKWYLLICSPLVEPGGKKNYSSKISHLINELSSYKTSYHVVYGPQHAVNILRSDLMEEAEFRSIKSQYFFEDTDWRALLRNLKPDTASKSYLEDLSLTSASKRASSAARYSEYLNLTAADEIQSAIDDLKDLSDLLGSLSKKTREFLCVCIARGKVISVGMSDRIAVLFHDILNFLPIDKITVQREIAVLESYHIAYLDDLEGYGTNYSIVIQNGNPNYNIFLEVKKFCKIYDINIQCVIVDLDFSCFD